MQGFAAADAPASFRNEELKIIDYQVELFLKLFDESGRMRIFALGSTRASVEASCYRLCRTHSRQMDGRSL